MDISSESLRPGWLVRSLAWVWIKAARINKQKYKDSGWNSYAEKLQFKFIKFINPRLGGMLCKAVEERRANLKSLNQGLPQPEPILDAVLGRKPTQTEEDKSLAAISFDVFKLHGRQESADQIVDSSCTLTFKHSGTGGDIIYSLPAMKALSKGRPVKLFLNPFTRKDHEENDASHPFNLQMGKLLIPLLEHQIWLTSVEIYNGETVDYDLDLFRKIPNIQTGRHSIPHWYFWMYAVTADLSQPWLEVRPAPAPGSKIVLARSGRYRNHNLDYAFLRHYGEIDFVGTAPEFQEMKQTVPQLQHVICEDLLQLARVIKAARFFIGNQSLPFAIAEAMKVPRILEIYPRLPDVVPTGANTGEAFFQTNFETLVKQFSEQIRSPGQ